ncbi:MAG: hypothetical protein K2M96_07925 [Prevotella sp.]|nr:hypothetical protein [Prevotella sp.]
MKKIYNIFTLLVVAFIGLSLTACSEDDYDTNPYNKSGVNLLAFGPSPNTRSEEIRITGTNLTAVDKVVFPGGTIERAGQIINVSGAEVEKAQFNAVDNENIYVNIPQETVPGHIKLVVGLDTITSEGTLTFTEPIEVTSVSPTEELNAGDEISIKGDYVYNIAEVIFTSGVSGAPVVAEDFTYVSREEIRLRVPLAAESGTIAMNDGADWELEYKEPLNVITATVTGVTPSADFGQEIQITGNNLHTVESVLFPGGVAADFTVSADNKTITAIVPAECKSGAISLLLYSGAALTTDEFAVPTVTITSIEPNSDLVEGDVVTLTGENFDRIIGVSVPGYGDLEPEDYTITGDQLVFIVPEGMTDGNVVLTQNSNITASIGVEIRKLEGVIWMGKKDMDSWSDNWSIQRWGDADLWKKFREAISGPGQLTVHYKKTSSDFALKVISGDSWNIQLSGAQYDEWGNNIVDDPESGDYVINLSAEDAATMFGSDENGQGLIIAGIGYQLQYIKFVAAGAERTIWEGNEDLSDGHQPYIGSDAGAEFKEVDAAAGNVVRFYIEPTDPEWYFEVYEGHWGPLYGKWTGENTDLVVGQQGAVALTLTQAMIDAAYQQQWWGGIFVVQGKVKLTKVTVAPL